MNRLMLYVMQKAISNGTIKLEPFGFSVVRDLIMLYNDLLMTGDNPLFLKLEVFYIRQKKI